LFAATGMVRRFRSAGEQGVRLGRETASSAVHKDFGGADDMDTKFRVLRN